MEQKKMSGNQKQPNATVHWRFATLQHLPRRFQCAFRLRQAGFIRNLTFPRETNDRKLELSIRLASSEEILRETLDGKEYRTRYPAVILKVPGIAHTQEIRSPRDSVFFSYDPSLADAMRAAGLLEPPLIWECRLTPSLLERLHLVDRLLDRHLEDGVADELDLLALQIWEELMIDRDSARNADPVSAQIKRVCSWLQLHFTETIDYDDLARENGFSRRAFFRNWKKYMPLTPARYVLGLRLEESCRLLKESRLSIWEIADRLRFSHAEYFCFVFRKAFGMTPLQYRKISCGPEGEGPAAPSAGKR